MPVSERTIRRWLAEGVGARLAERASHLIRRTVSHVTRRDERSRGEAKRSCAWRGRARSPFRRKPASELSAVAIGGPTGTQNRP